MKGKIDKDFYCCGFSENICGHFPSCPKTCRQYKRKHLTPEQFKEEYGEDVPDDMPVWVVCGRQKEDETVWEVYRYGDLCNAVGRDEIKKGIIVVACTPFPKPDNDWRPQEVKK